MLDIGGRWLPQDYSTCKVDLKIACAPLLLDQVHDYDLKGHMGSCHAIFIQFIFVMEEGRPQINRYCHRKDWCYMPRFAV